jgi:hypothetical protein
LADGAPTSLSATSDLAGGAVIAWQSPRPDPLSGERHIYAQNVSNLGTLGGSPITAVDQSHTSELPLKITLQQNYPNPFNPSTTIQFELPSASYVALKIFNLLGQEVATLINEKRDAGQHTVQWNALGLASGVYFYRLHVHPIDAKQINDFVQTKKLLLIR